MPGDSSRNLLISTEVTSYLEVIKFNGDGPTAQPEGTTVFDAFYGPKDDMAILFFVLHTEIPGEEPEHWSDELAKEAVLFYSDQVGFTDLMMIHRRPFQSIYESSNSFLEAVPGGYKLKSGQSMPFNEFMDL